MKVTMTRNYAITDMSESMVKYLSRTFYGSSGAPIFNQNWEVVAMAQGAACYPLNTLEILESELIKAIVSLGLFQDY